MPDFCANPLSAIVISLLPSTIGQPLHLLQYPIASHSERVTCRCENEATNITSWRDRNPRRQFWNCTRCGFLRWPGPPMCARTLVVIPSLISSMKSIGRVGCYCKCRTMEIPANVVLFMGVHFLVLF